MVDIVFIYARKLAVGFVVLPYFLKVEFRLPETAV